MSDVLFVDIRHILDNWYSHGLLLKECTNLINFFYTVINGVHVFGNIFFSKKIELLLNFAFCFPFLSTCYLASLKKRSHNTLSVVAESAIEHILMAIVWLYGFESVFGQVLFDFLFVVYMFFL